MAARISKDEFEAEVLKASVPVLLEFYSDSCIPCKQMSPTLSYIESTFEGKIKVLKINVNFDQEVAQKYEVMASPTIIFFKDGQEVERLRGLVKKPELEEKVKEILD